MSDVEWERIEPLLPSNAGRRGHPFGPSRRVVEGIIYRCRTGMPWRDLPREVFEPWQTVWKRHGRYAADRTWERVLAELSLQTAVRHLLPARRSTSGAEAATQRLRDLYEGRSFSLRNAHRTNLLLGLTRIHLNNRDDVSAYRRILRRYAEATGGQSRQRSNRDTRTANGAPQPSLR